MEGSLCSYGGTPTRSSTALPHTSSGYGGFSSQLEPINSKLALPHHRSRRATHGHTALSLKLLSRSKLQWRSALAASSSSLPSSSSLSSSAATIALQDGVATKQIVQPLPPIEQATTDDTLPTHSEGESTVSITVVGASGDLAKKKIFPALFALYYEGCLPKEERGSDPEPAPSSAILPEHFFRGGPWRYPLQRIRAGEFFCDIIILQDSRRKGPHFLGSSVGPFHRFTFDPEYLMCATWEPESISDALYLQVETRLEDLVGDTARELLADFDLGIGRLIWRDSLSAWLLPVTFILHKDKCNSFGLFLLAPRHAAPALGIQESILADWMTVMIDGLGPGYPLPWALDSD